MFGNYSHCHRLYWIAGLACLLIIARAVPTFAAEEKPVNLDKDPTLAGWWKLDDKAGETAADSSPHGRKAVLKGGLSFKKHAVPGPVGGALKIEGEDQYLEVTGYKGVAGNKPRTIAAWIKTERDRGEIMSWGKDDFGQMWIFGFIRGAIGVTPSGGYYYMQAEANDNQWHHIAVVVGEAELPNLHDDVQLYLDAEIQEIDPIGLLDLWPVNTGEEMDVRIARGFQGLLDDVRLYERPLTDEEIRVLASKGKPPKD